MKCRTFAAVLALLVFIAMLPLSSAAAQEAPEAMLQIVDAGFSCAPALQYLEQNGNVEALTLPEDIYIRYLTSTGEEELLYDMSADWDFDGFDACVLGSQSLVGRVQIPDGYAYLGEDGEEAALLLELPVLVCAPEEIPKPKTPILRYGFVNTQPLLTLPQNGDVSALSMPEDVAIFFGRGFRDWFLADGVDWDIDAFDSTLAGRQTITGRVRHSDDYALFDENDQEIDVLVEQPVFVYSSESTSLETVYISQPPYLQKPPLIPLGCTSEEAETILQQELHAMTRLSTEDGFWLSCPSAFDVSLIDLQQAGAYMPYCFDLPPGIEIQRSPLDDYLQMVFVLDPDEVDLSAAYMTVSSFTLNFEWLYQAEHPALWHTTASPLEQESTVEWVLSPSSYADLSSTSILLYLTELERDAEPNAEYWFQVRHDNGASNYLHISMADMSFEITPTEGDRSGGDREPGGSTEIPDVSTPAPSDDDSDDFPPPKEDALSSIEPIHTAPEHSADTPPTATPEIDSAPAIENPPESYEIAPPPRTEVSLVASTVAKPTHVEKAPPSPSIVQSDIPPEAMTFTADELAALRSIHGETIPFSFAAGTVCLPEGMLASAKLDRFSVLLCSSKQGELSLRLWSDGTELTEPFEEPFSLVIPWTDGDAVCTDACGAEVSCQFDRESSSLTLTAYQAGLFTLAPRSADDAVTADLAKSSAALVSNAEQAPDLLPATLEQEPIASAQLLAIAVLLGALIFSAVSLLRRRKRS